MMRKAAAANDVLAAGLSLRVRTGQGGCKNPRDDATRVATSPWAGMRSRPVRSPDVRHLQRVLDAGWRHQPVLVADADRVAVLDQR